MTRITTLLVGAGALITASSALARIGETEAQIVARYGQPLSIPSKEIQGQPLKVFRSAGLTVGVAFIDGKSGIFEFYST